VNILLIDDDEDDRLLFAEVVREIDSSIECVTISNAEAALNGLISMAYQRPDVIFLDLNMPKIDGLECLKELKNDHSLMDIPVAIYTTSCLERDIKKALKLGADTFIIKPMSFDQVFSAIKFTLNSFDLLNK
jgi:CheY-like chemotaxis protein